MFADLKDDEYLKGLTLLYVEDEEATRELYLTFLSRLVGTVLTAGNGAEGMDAYCTHSPDIILTDIRMPVMDGLDMAGIIRESDPSVPIVVLTAFDQGEYLINSINIGIDRYVTKPAVGRQIEEALLKCANRLLVEKQLADERQRLRYVIEGTKAGSWEWDVLSGVIKVNERWGELIGYRPEELPPVTIAFWRGLIHHDDLQNSSELLEKCFRGEARYFECDMRMRHKNGRWVWVLSRGKVASWSDDGLPKEMYGTNTDLSIRKQLEIELKKNNEQILEEKTQLAAALAHIKRLEGIMPICSYCKK